MAADFVDCISEVSKGNADVVLGKIGWNLIPVDQSVVPCPPMTQQGQYILSPYNCSREKALMDSSPTDMTDIVHSFTPAVWTSALATFFILSLLVWIHHRNHNRNKAASSSWTVITHLLLNPSFQTYNWVSNLIIMNVTVYVFLFVVMYLKNVITTDQVMMREQKVYRSYRDIVEGVDKLGEDVKLLYTTQSGILDDLLSDPRHEIKDRIHYHITHGRGRLINNMMDAVTCEFDTALLGGYLVSKLAKFFTCSFALPRRDHDMPDCCVHRTEEPEVFPSTVNGFMVSSKMVGTPIYHRIEGKDTLLFLTQLMKHL